MIIVEGKLRRMGDYKFKDEPARKKLTVETEIDSDKDGEEADLALIDFYMDPAKVGSAKVGSHISLSVRPYMGKKGVGYSAVRVVKVG